MSSSPEFTKDNINDYLKAVAKEYRKIAGKKTQAEIVLIGGASILINYSFRNMTMDVDAIINASSAMKEAINTVGDEHGLPSGWLNTDFTKTTSYSPKLVQFSTYYRTFLNVLDVRTISAEYLIAMKVMAGREYKNDLSDIIGILYEHKTQGEPITWERVDTAVHNLYGGWDSVSMDSKEYIQAAIRDDDILKKYSQVRSYEQGNKEVLTEMFGKYPDMTKNKELDIDQILKNANTNIKLGVKKRNADAQDKSNSNN